MTSYWLRSAAMVGALLLALPALGAAQRSTEELGRAPVFTPMTVRPEILNQQEIVREMQLAYPSVLRDAGIGGTVFVHFFIDETGRVRNKMIEKTSGHAQLDEAALSVADVYRFRPAMNRDEAVPVWVAFPLTFRVNNPAGAAAPATRAPVQSSAAPTRASAGASPSAEISAAPRFTPMTVRPEIQNQADIMREMTRAYPPMLRDAGIGGTVVVNFFVDATGRVQNLVIDRSSGHAQLDEAALRVARTYRFTPAMNRDQAVAVWVTFPLIFRVGPM